MTSRDLDRLQDTLGHRFANPDLLALALTHASAVNASRGARQTYQELEFLGDRVLGLVVADMLTEDFPTATEGDLSRWFHRLVSGDVCAEVANELQLAKYLKMGRGPKKSAGAASPGVLADVCEAVIAAVYRDGGIEAARGLIERRWRPLIAGMSGPHRDAKTELQEWAHRRGFEAPAYTQVARSGPDHKPEFDIEVTVGDAAPEKGRGGSKREAEQEAAAGLLRREGVWEKP
jgi:ribonuclease III